MSNIWHIYHIKHQKTSFIRCCKSHKLCNIEQQLHIFATVRMKCGLNLLFFYSVFLSPLISLIDFFSPQPVFFALLTICLSLPNRCSFLKSNPKIFFLQIQKSNPKILKSNSRFKTKPRNGIITNPERTKESAMKARQSLVPRTAKP